MENFSWNRKKHECPADPSDCDAEEPRTCDDCVDLDVACKVKYAAACSVNGGLMAGFNKKKGCPADCGVSPTTCEECMNMDRMCIGTHHQKCISFGFLFFLI